MKKIIILAFCIGLALSFMSTGCSPAVLFRPGAEDNVESVPVIVIDEREIGLINNIDEELETSYHMDTGILASEEVNDPFKPYYRIDEEEKENTLFLEQIYLEDGLWYAKIKFNEFLYKLNEGDVFANVYKLEVVHENSVVLLKGDEILTVSLGQLLYD